MEKSPRIRLLPLLLTVFCLGFTHVAVWAGSSPEAGIVVMTSGDTAAEGIDHNKRTLSRRSQVFVGDKLLTGNDAQLQLRMKDGAMIAIGPNAELFISAYNDDKANDKKDAAVLKLMQGGLRTITGSINKSTYKMETPVATLGIRGTVYDVYVKGDGTITIILRDGAVDITGESGITQKLDLKGLAVIVERGKAPGKPGPVPPDVLEYLKKFIPDLPDDITWQTNDDGSTSLNLGDDIINIINTPPPAETGDGSVPGEQETLPPPAVEPPIDNCTECCSPTSCGMTAALIEMAAPDFGPIDFADPLPPYEPPTNPP